MRHYSVLITYIQMKRAMRKTVSHRRMIIGEFHLTNKNKLSKNNKIMSYLLTVISGRISANCPPLAGWALHFWLDPKTKQKTQGSQTNASSSSQSPSAAGWSSPAHGRSFPVLLSDCFDSDCLCLKAISLHANYSIQNIFLLFAI